MPAAGPFEALGDPNRRAILQLLGDGERSVQQLADGLPISRPAVSRHLRLLREAGLVEQEVVGARRIYRVPDEGGGRRGGAALSGGGRGRRRPPLHTRGGEHDETAQ